MVHARVSVHHHGALHHRQRRGPAACSRARSTRVGRIDTKRSSRFSGKRRIRATRRCPSQRCDAGSWRRAFIRGSSPLVRHERGTLAGLPTETFTPIAWTEADPTMLYLHGGGYIVCSPATHRDLVSRIAEATGARCIALNYRKAPEHPFPAPIDDAEAAYRALLESGIPADRLFVGGDSAGGGLTLALLLRIRGASLPMPRAAVLLSPWVDLECTGESIRTNAAVRLSARARARVGGGAVPSGSGQEAPRSVRGSRRSRRFTAAPHPDRQRGAVPVRKSASCRARGGARRDRHAPDRTGLDPRLSSIRDVRAGVRTRDRTDRRVRAQFHADRRSGLRRENDAVRLASPGLPQL